MNIRTYEKAWDMKLNRWVNPEDVNRGDWHDKPRFVSEKPNIAGEGGLILTICRPFKRQIKKTNKVFNVRMHFRPLKSLKENTFENRQKIFERETSRESEIHKICKELISSGEVKNIDVPEINVPLPIGNSYIDFKIPGKTLEILEVEAVEKRDSASNTIPDISVKARIGTKIQRFFIEIYYRHPVDEFKKYSYKQNSINCIEIDVGDYYNLLEDGISADRLRERLKQEIETQAYWISSNIEETFYKAITKNFNVINTKDLLRQSELDVVDRFNRAYVFEDTLKLRGIVRNSKRTHNIGECQKCERCVGIVGYDSDSINDINVLCAMDSIPENSTDSDKIQIVLDRIMGYVNGNAEDIR